MNTPPEWQRLIAAARQAPAASDPEAPLGFSTRVAAQAMVRTDQASSVVFARFSWQALALATLIMVVTVATTLQPVLNGLADEVATFSDPVLESGDSV